MAISLGEVFLESLARKNWDCVTAVSSEFDLLGSHLWFPRWG